MAAGITYFRQTLDADPRFADAAVVLALTYYEQVFTSLAPSGIFELSRHAAESAPKLNPKLGLVHAALGPVEGCVEGAQLPGRASKPETTQQRLARASHVHFPVRIWFDLVVALVPRGSRSRRVCAAD